MGIPARSGSSNKISFLISIISYNSATNSNRNFLKVLIVKL